MRAIISAWLLCSCLVFTVVNSTFFVTYVDEIQWSSAQAIAASIGIPGYAKQTAYNIINLAFWTTTSGPVDAAEVWSSPLQYVGSGNPWGTSDEEIRAAWLAALHTANIKILVSAFGATNFPTSEDPVATANNLAAFVKNNSLDGVDLDYEDNTAMNEAIGEAWIINVTKGLRQQLPKSQGYILTHAPQAPYFMGPPQYTGGGYLKVHQQVGDMIDFYNVQFYNQDSTDYATLTSLFSVSDGWATNTSVAQLISNGIPADKIVVGKPVTTADQSNTGYIDVDSFKNILEQAVNSTTWNTGIMGWQYSSDVNGTWVGKLATAFSSTAGPSLSGAPIDSNSTSSIAPSSGLISSAPSNSQVITDGTTDGNSDGNTADNTDGSSASTLTVSLLALLS